MTDPRVPAKPSSHLSSSALSPAPHAAVLSSVRPRNRRVVSSGEDDDVSGPRPPDQDSGLLSAYSASTSRTASPRPRPRPPGHSGTSTSPNRDAAGAGTLGQFLGDSWTQSWSSVQGFASTLMSVGDDPLQKRGGSQQPRSRFRGAPHPGDWALQRSSSSAGTSKNQTSWGPAPPSRNPGLGDVAAGSLAERETALKAARTASVLESHDGVNGGLDVTGKHKRRNSDEVAPDSSRPEDCLVYIHHVQPDDTYAGLVLRYKCREDVFRRANGLWSRDSIQTRKWLTLPVDACEIRGRLCEAPSWHNSRGVDLLAPTPTAADESSSGRQVTPHGDFFSGPANGGTADDEKAPDEDTQWTHVRWVQIDSFRHPVQIGRVARQALGYFPPRRKKSIRTASSLSTPRQSFDLSSIPPGSVERPSSRRQSSLSSRPQLSGTPVSSRSRVGSDTANARPAWMRRPGGVGSMGRNIRAPGPDKDYFNSWTSKHLPGLNIEALPSMSVMGSETARFGFASGSSGIVEGPFEDGRDTASASRQGSGLDRAAAAVESWLRGALAKRPSTPLIGSRARSTGLPAGRDDGGDLIELADTGSEDGSLLMHNTPTALLDSLSLGTTGTADGDGSVRGRATMTAGGMRGRQKAD
ncbi:Uncharacterized protein TPAR_03161 [Tolypocladium paradoxum]|uniref:LysM domain-containing protein n=1 Tax=Tolypocladium paradoxum TaxID=94208 RepID=A0A2S4L2M9_9HYPO|nr:Uncharacterized protein TPAR_03161 [Tolypocladium paradoxum]